MTNDFHAGDTAWLCHPWRSPFFSRVRVRGMAGRNIIVEGSKSGRGRDGVEFVEARELWTTEEEARQASIRSREKHAKLVSRLRK